MKKNPSKNRFLTLTLSVVLSVLVIVSVVSAATTISTNIDTGGTLNVTGKTTLTNASTTMISSTGDLWVNGYATTTASNGNIDTAGNISAVGTASSTSLIVGGNSTTVGGIVFGYCNVQNSANIAASTTAYFSCTGATGVTSATRIFVQATSSLSAGLILHSASSTVTDGSISLQIFNATSTATAPGTISINFFGIR